MALWIMTLSMTLSFFAIVLLAYWIWRLYAFISDCIADKAGALNYEKKTPRNALHGSPREARIQDNATSHDEIRVFERKNYKE